MDVRGSLGVPEDLSIELPSNEGVASSYRSLRRNGSGLVSITIKMILISFTRPKME